MAATALAYLAGRQPPQDVMDRLGPHPGEEFYRAVSDQATALEKEANDMTSPS